MREDLEDVYRVATLPTIASTLIGVGLWTGMLGVLAAGVALAVWITLIAVVRFNERS